MKAKRVYDEFKPYFTFGKKFAKSQPNICFTICKYACDNLTKRYHADKTIFNDEERKMLMKEVTELNNLNATSVDELEYTEFLENIYANVDEEDREGTVTEATAFKFKMLSVLIDVFKIWNPDVAGEWAVKSKIQSIICILGYHLLLLPTIRKILQIQGC